MESYVPLPFMDRRMVASLLTEPQKAFNVPYSVCKYCPAPSPRPPIPRSPSALGNVMGRFLRSLRDSPWQSLVPAMETILAALGPLAADDTDATHSSGHYLKDLGSTR